MVVAEEDHLPEEEEEVHTTMSLFLFYLSRLLTTTSF